MRPRLRCGIFALSVLTTLVACTASVERSGTTSYGLAERPDLIPSEERRSLRAARHDEPVLVLGDSLAQGARDAGRLIEKLAEAGWSGEVVAEIGRGIPWVMDRLAWRPSVPPTIVLVLGTNPSPTVGRFPEEVTELLDRLTELGAKRFLWVPPVHRDPERYRERQMVLEQAASDERILLTDWPAVAAEQPGWFSGDGIHLSANGYDALASSITDWLDVLDRR